MSHSLQVSSNQHTISRLLDPKSTLLLMAKRTVLLASHALPPPPSTVVVIGADDYLNPTTNNNIYNVHTNIDASSSHSLLSNSSTANNNSKNTSKAKTVQELKNDTLDKQHTDTKSIPRRNNHTNNASNSKGGKPTHITQGKGVIPLTGSLPRKQQAYEEARANGTLPISSPTHHMSTLPPTHVFSPLLPDMYPPIPCRSLYLRTYV